MPKATAPAPVRVNNVPVPSASSNSKVTNVNVQVQQVHVQQVQVQQVKPTRNPVPYNFYPPPYPSATTTTPAAAAVVTQQQRWEPPPTAPQLQDLTATLTDFKQTDLDFLLPNITASPLLDLPDVLNENRTVLLINPLTGELEPQLGDESDEEFRDVFTGKILSIFHWLPC